MRPPPKTSDSKLTQNPTHLEYENFICYFDPHDNLHHPTTISTFHPRRLPHGGWQTPSKY